MTIDNNSVEQWTLNQRKLAELWNRMRDNRAENGQRPAWDQLSPKQQTDFGARFIEVVTELGCSVDQLVKMNLSASDLLSIEQGSYISANCFYCGGLASEYDPTLFMNSIPF